MEVKEIGKCEFCKDPILDFQEMTVIRGKKYHAGCYKIFSVAKGQKE